MEYVFEPIVTSRFKATDFRKCCVLNSDVTYESLDKRVSLLSTGRGHSKGRSRNSRTKAQKLRKY